MKRSAFVALTGGALAVPRIARAQSAPITIRVATAPVESYALMFYGIERGFFKAANLDVQMQVFGAGGGVMQAAGGGAIDIGCANVGAQANAFVAGLPLSMIAAGGLYSTASPTTVLAIAKNAPFRTAKDINGKVVGVSTLHDLQQASVLKWVDDNGGDSSTLKFIETPPPTMAPALTAGRIDAACMLEPSLTYSKDDIRVLGKCYDAIATRLAITSHFATNSWLAANPAAAHAFIGALRETARWANANLAASSAILADVSKIPLSTIGEMHRVTFGEVLDPKTIQPVIDATAQYKFLAKDFNVTDMFWAQARA
jgi:NitT/TauT family transport system substrate-binding protein